MKKLDKEGFTLLEMLLVIAVLAILVAILLPTTGTLIEKARQAADVANIRAYVAQVQLETLDHDLAECPSLKYLTTVSSTGIVAVAKGAASRQIPGGYGKSGLARYKTAFKNGVLTVTYVSTLLKEGNLNLNTYQWQVAGMQTLVSSAPVRGQTLRMG